MNHRDTLKRRDLRVCDGCPLDPNKTEPGECGCGEDDNADADEDGVPDCNDICPGLDDTIYAPNCIPPVPTISSWGVLILTLLLLTVGSIVLKARAGRPTHPTL